MDRLSQAIETISDCDDTGYQQYFLPEVSPFNGLRSAFGVIQAIPRADWSKDDNNNLYFLAMAAHMRHVLRNIFAEIEEWNGSLTQNSKSTHQDFIPTTAVMDSVNIIQPMLAYCDKYNFLPLLMSGYEEAHQKFITIAVLNMIKEGATLQLLKSVLGGDASRMHCVVDADGELLKGLNDSWRDPVSRKANLRNQNLFSTTKTIGLYGGTFDPPHLGHLMMAQEMYQHLGCDEVWMMVTPQNPFKSGTTDYEHRLAMCRIMAASHPWLVVSDFERGQENYETATSLARLRAAHPDTQFVFSIGTDNLENFHLWGRWQEILENHPVLIMGRPFIETDSLPLAVEWAQQQDFWHDDTQQGIKPGFIKMENTLIEASSTVIREAIMRQPKSRPANLAPNVHRYIVQENLYKPAGNVPTKHYL